jgi:hypothetical protein
MGLLAAYSRCFRNDDMASESGGPTWIVELHAVARDTCIYQPPAEFDVSP